MCIHVVSEVEKELQGAAGACNTPLMSYKKPHAGSTGNIHGLVVLADQAAASGLCLACTISINLCIVLYYDE